jgi:hypothetical protein
MNMAMEIIAYVLQGWNPRLRPATSRRDWMDASPERFAYRCLPLAMANAHGWEVLSPCGFTAVWNGGMLPEDVQVTLDHGTKTDEAAVALFGQATVTFHVPAVFKTPLGWNLWVSGSPNQAKDGIAPLSGLIETDWSPYSFTMNWRFTRANHPVRFEENEPIAFLMPVQRGAVEGFTARIAPMEEAPDLKAGFQMWSASRDAFHEQMRTNPPLAPADKWQKLYYRGVAPDGTTKADDHQTKLRVCPFSRTQSNQTD